MFGYRGNPLITERLAPLITESSVIEGRKHSVIEVNVISLDNQTKCSVIEVLCLVIEVLCLVIEGGNCLVIKASCSVIERRRRSVIEGNFPR